MPNGEPNHRRRTTDKTKWPIERILVTVTMFLSIIAVIFSLGVNYQRLSSQERRLDDLINAVQNTYVRRDVSTAQWESVDYQLNQLRVQVEELRMVVITRSPLPVVPSSPARPRFK